MTAAEFAERVSEVARGLMAAGIARGDRVGLMAGTRYEWTLLDYAILAAGAVVVPIYETSSAEQVEWILADSGAVGVVVESPVHAAAVKSLDLPLLQHLWTIDSGSLDVLAAAGFATGVSLLAVGGSLWGLAVTLGCLTAFGVGRLALHDLVAGTGVYRNALKF